MSNELIRITLTPLEGLLLATMIDEMVSQLTPQLDSMDQDQRTFFTTMQRVRSFLPTVKQ